MSRLIFWNEWKTPFKILYLTLLGIFSVTLLLFLIAYIAGIKLFLDWDIVSQFDTIVYSADQFTHNLYNYSVTTTNYIAKDRFAGTNIPIFPWAGALYLLVITSVMLIGVTISTRLEIAGFVIGMGLFIFFLFYLNADLMMLFGTEPSRKFTILMILSFAGLGFYFQAYDQKFSFMQRLLAFSLLAVVFSVLIAFLSRNPYPFFFLSNFGIIIPILLSLIFIVSVSFDIINGFLFVTSSKNSNRNNLLHFVLISTFYLINILLIFLKKKGLIPDSFITIDVFIIYIFSAVLGIWGARKRIPLFQNLITPSHSAVLYLVFAIITTSTMLYAFATANDPMIEMFRYILMYSHLGIGLIFFLYIMYNFWELFEKNIPAYDLVYQPRRMPFFMVRPIGIIIMISLSLQSNNVVFKLGRSAYHCLTGDVYYAEDKLAEAYERYYEGMVFGKPYLKPNYSIASVLIKQGKKQEAIRFYENVLDREKTEYPFANLANIQMEDDTKFFYARHTLVKGLAKFPKSGVLHNNMAMLYGKKGIWDSCYYHLSLARQFLNEDATSGVNMSWFMLTNKLKEEADSISSRFDYKDNLSYQVNRTAAFTLANKDYSDDREKFLGDSILTIRTYAYFYNLVLNSLQDTDTSIVAEINNYSKYESNTQFYFELQFLKALKLFYSGYRQQAITHLQNNAGYVIPATALYYNKILGIWAMKMGAHHDAINYFHEASKNLNDAQALLFKAIALLESGYTSDSQDILKTLLNTPDEEVKKTAENLLAALAIKTINDAIATDEVSRYRFIHYRKESLSEADLVQLLSSFTDAELKVLAAAEASQYYIEKNELQKASQLVVTQDLSKLKNTSYALGMINYQKLELLKAQASWSSLLENATKLTLADDKKHLSSLYKAIAYKNLGNVKEAEKQYRALLREAPLSEEAYLAATEFYTSLEKPDQAYQILLDGTRMLPNSSSILKAYILSALGLNLETFAESSAETLKEMITPSEHSQFMKEYQKAKAEANAKFEQY